MFGQNNPSPFGSPPGQPTGFGSTAPAFGSPPAAPFGAQPSTTPFGGGTAFGSPPAPSGFGTAPSAFGTSAPSGFGTSTFGAQQPSTSAFGGGGGSTFGSTAPSAFGAIAPAPSTGLFGSSNPSTSGGLFGGGGGTGGFGSSTTSTFGGGGLGGGAGGFGSSTTTGFGASTTTPSSGLFGAAAPNPAFGGSTFGAPGTGGFGAAPSGGLFGAPAPAPASGLFGATSAGVGGGSKVAPYQATTRQDGTTSIQLHAITAMQQYEGKSFEELRYEDYAQGNKGSASSAGGTSGFGGFGATSTGIFGSTTPAPAPFGAPATGGFGAASTPGFGMSSTGGGFGAATPAPAPTAFGAPSNFGAPSTGLFGAAAPAPAFGAFGSTAPKPGGLFGAPAPAQAPATGLFGSAPAPAPSMFGAAPASAPGGLFGAAPAPAPVGLFGSTPAFGAPAPAGSGGLFGAPAPAPSGGMFGAPASGLFGAPAPAPAFGGSSFFGAPAPAPSGGLFGAPKPQGTGLFGSPSPGGGLFGAPAPAPTGGYFGGAPAASPAAPQSFFASAPINIAAPLASDVLAQQMAALENQRKELEKLDVWRGKSPDIASVVPTSLSESEANTIVPYRGYARPYGSSPKSQTQIRPRGFHTLSATKSPPQLSLTPHGTNNERVMMSPSTLVSSSVKRLVVRPESLTPKPKLRLQFEDSPRDGVARLNGHANSENSMLTLHSATTTKAPESGSQDDQGNQGRQAYTPSDAASPGYDYYQRVVAAPDEAGGGTSTPEDKSSGGRAPLKHAPKLTKVGYHVSPPMDELEAMSEADLAAVPNFSVTRDGFGRVEWEGAVDVRDVNLDQVVSIENVDVAVYAEEEENGTKPPEGTKLNRPASITLWNVFPKEGDGIENFVRKIKKCTVKMGAELISYEPEIGEWTFRVLHFSRYGLYDSSDEDEEPSTPREAAVRADGSGTLKLLSLTPDKDADTGDHMVTYVSDVDMSESDYPGSTPMRQAEEAYETLSKMIEESDVSVDDDVVGVQTFADEVASPDIHLRTQHGVFPNDYNFSLSWTGISANLKAKARLNAKTTATDASLRFGRSFGVCWHPDGSFFRQCLTTKGIAGPTLMRCRPTFSNSDSDQSLPKRLLETQLVNSVKTKQSECSLYILPAGYANSGTESSQKALTKAVVEFSFQSYPQSKRQRSDDPEIDLVGHRAFELLSCLIDTSDSDISGRAANGDVASFMDESNRLEAVSRWVVDACKHDVETNIEFAKHSNTVPGAILAAITGGDLEKASLMASSNGFPQLGSLLMAGPAGINDLRNQISEWRKTGVSLKIPAPLLRVYTLLGGELEQSENLGKSKHEQLDWRRYFALRLLFGRDGSYLSGVIRSFCLDVMDGAVAYPYPRYSDSSSHGENALKSECTLYRLLQLFDNPSQCILSDLIQPVGHTQCVDDFALSFHLASILTAIGVCHQLTPLEEARLVDSYAAQLLDSECWEWAVFVQFCSLTTACTDNPSSRFRKAKEMVLTYFTPTHPGARAIRSFLENKVGVPKEWFEEALALRCATNGDILGFVLHASSFAMERALQTLECIFLPNLFFMSTGDIEASMKLLQACDSCGSPLAEALNYFFDLSNEVRWVSQASREVIVEQLPFLIETAREIEATLVSYQAKSKTLSPSSLNVYPDYRMVPMESFLAEAITGLSQLKLQLRALEVNLPIPGVTQPTKPSPVEGFTANAMDAVNSDFGEKILRGYIDGEMQS